VWERRSNSLFLELHPYKQAKYSESLVEQQMMKALAPPTNNAEQFCGRRKGG